VKESALIRLIRDRYRYDPTLKLFRTNVVPKVFNTRYYNKTRQCWVEKKAFAESLPKGFADLLGILRPSGRAIFIETKVNDNNQNIDQKAFQDLVESQGAIYILARSLEDVENRINSLKS